MTLQEVLLEELQELLCLEKGFMLTLPMMVQSVHDLELQGELERIYDQTRGQIARLERLIPASAATAGATRSCRLPELDGVAPPVRDALLVATARKLQHQKIAGYSTVQTWAHTLNLPEVEQSLAQSLQEEQENCELLRRLALETANTA